MGKASNANNANNVGSTEKKQIIITKMFVGDYLKQGKLGHEIINLFKSDDGDNYLYLPPYGDYAASHFGKEVNKVILSRYISDNKWEIVAVAEGISPVFENTVKHAMNELRECEKYVRWPGSRYMKDLCEKNSRTIYEIIHNKQCDYCGRIKYGAVTLPELYENNMDYIVDSKNKIRRYENYVTFKAESIKMPKKPLYIVGKEHTSPQDAKTFKFEYREKKLPRQSFTIFVESDTDDYSALDKWLSTDKEWEDSSAKYEDKKNSIGQVTYLQLIKQQFDELAYSNSIAYYLKKSPEFYTELLKLIVNKTKNSFPDKPCFEIHNTIKKYTVERERENIDILMIDEKNVVVIENKIKSDFNGKNGKESNPDAQTQLSKYRHLVEEGKNSTKKKLSEDDKDCEDGLPPIKQNGQIAYYSILVPDYYVIAEKYQKEIEGCEYVIIRYSELLGILEQLKDMDNLKSDDYFSKEFIPDIKIHSSSYGNTMESACLQTLSSYIEDSIKKQK